MRITNSMVVNKFLSDANSSLGRVSKYQGQVDSTKRISRISDDPLATLTALKARNKLSNISLYESNISAASSYLTETESSVGELNELCQKAYEEMQSAISGSKTQDELDVIKEEFENLKKEALSISNNTLGSSYLFGGYNFTGSSNGVTKTPPFSVDDATGDLNYNGINLSQFSWKDEFDNSTSLLQGFAGTISDVTTKLGATTSDFYAKNTLCENGKDALSDLVTTAKSALESAKEFGIDDSSAEYTALSGVKDYLETLYNDFYNETSKEVAGDYILDTDPAIVKNSDDSINTEYYKEKGITVMTQADLDNHFSIADAKSILDRAADWKSTLTLPTTALKNTVKAAVTKQDAESALSGLLKDSALTLDFAGAIPDPTGSTLRTSLEAALSSVKSLSSSVNLGTAAFSAEVDTALDGLNTALTDVRAELPTSFLGDPSLLKTAKDVLSGVITIPTATQDALTAEAAKRTSLPIGVEQSLDFGVTGIDLFGTGRENIYHVLDKCTKLLGSGASADQLSGMVTELQNAQQNVLTLQTKVGSTENRIELISNRYTTSKANYTQMKSEAEDVDMAEAITNLNTAKTVYSAALAAGSKIMQTSLIDFLR